MAAAEAGSVAAAEAGAAVATASKVCLFAVKGAARMSRSLFPARRPIDAVQCQDTLLPEPPSRP